MASFLLASVMYTRSGWSSRMFGVLGGIGETPSL
ncbi:Uncharacterised protein [Mycobacteroides abscessus subsp. abscessus]|nr:Uncharacterised protein [Mycobacteroides abscessus subsp. abscessus]